MIRITAAVTGGCMVIFATLFGIYNFGILRRVKKRHGREMRIEEEEARSGEGYVRFF